MNRAPVLTHSEYEHEQEINYLLSQGDFEVILLPQHDITWQFSYFLVSYTLWFLYTLRNYQGPQRAFICISILEITMEIV